MKKTLALEFIGYTRSLECVGFGPVRIGYFRAANGAVEFKPERLQPDHAYRPVELFPTACIEVAEFERRPVHKHDAAVEASWALQCCRFILNGRI